MVVTYTLGFLVVPKLAAIVPVPLPAKYIFGALKLLLSSRVLVFAELPVTYILPILDVMFESSSVYKIPLPVKIKFGAVIIFLNPVPTAEVSVPIVRSFEDETIPSLIKSSSILLVARLRSMLLDVSTYRISVVNLEFKNGVKLDPFCIINHLLVISFSTFTELFLMYISILLVRLLDIVITLGVLMVSEPTFNSLPAKSMEVKLEPERVRLGVALEVIEPVKVKFPAIVKVLPAALFQSTLLLDIKDRPDIMEV